jgi:hypothetical protein
MRKWGTDKAVVSVSVYSQPKLKEERKSHQNFVFLRAECQERSRQFLTRYHTLSVNTACALSCECYSVCYSDKHQHQILPASRSEGTKGYQIVLRRNHDPQKRSL